MNETTQNTGTAGTAPAAAPSMAPSPEHAAFNEPKERDSRELNDLDDIAAALDDGEAAEGDTQGNAPEAGAADAAAQAPAAGGENNGNAPAPQDIPTPEGWEESLWQGMAPEARARVSGQIQEHAKALAAEKAAQQALIQRTESFAAASNAQIQQSLMMMRQVMEGITVNNFNALT